METNSKRPAGFKKPLMKSKSLQWKALKENSLRYLKSKQLVQYKNALKT
ncbi:MAG: hypothetical protein MAG794_00400 [Gammaproteobacteria bacterium]|nr:hypothetical protein [Gammaproteobacteria bacterium]